MEQAAKPKLKMLVAGGCHVFGHPLGKEYSFTAVACGRLAESAEVQVDTVRVSLKKSAPILEFLRREPVDALVIQVGNFECPMDVQRHIRMLLRRSRPTGRARGGIDGTPSARILLDPAMLFIPTLSWRIRSWARGVYDRMATALGRPLFEPDPFRAMLRELLRQIAELNLPCVIVLAPLPCADAAFQRHRLHGGEVMRQEVEAAGMLFLDAAKVLAGPDGRIANGMYAEALHLSREAQRLLGEALAKRMEEHLLAASRPVEIPR